MTKSRKKNEEGLGFIFKSLKQYNPSRVQANPIDLVMFS